MIGCTPRPNPSTVLSLTVRFMRDHGLKYKDAKARAEVEALKRGKWHPIAGLRCELAKLIAAEIEAEKGFDYAKGREEMRRKLLEQL